MNKLVMVMATFAIVMSTSCGDDIEFGVVHEQPLDTNRFVKVQLAGDFDEPMEIAVTPENKVVIIERKGAVKLFEPSVDTVRTIANMQVYSGQEDGLLGVALDPEFSKNHFIYFFYSPAGSSPMQRVSRFLLRSDSLDISSEKVLIEIPTQRQECCHSAGSLAFGPDGNLFIAVGDNTNPHNPGYYNSIDERKGREFWDAQRTAGNTNDLRGKILRIHPEADGSYTIPAGNLFPAGTEKARPEIYVMGSRNPYRIAVDQKKGWLYWGDVGQNTIDDPKRGPISYDEWHLATAAGFYGWPYFAGPNSPYTDFDYETNTNGPFFDSAKPKNTSPNNTGLVELPPAKGALIWYSYDESKLFPHLGTGGKSPIAGPTFYTDRYTQHINDTTRHMHAHYNGKVFIAEWMRDWINVLTLTEDGKLDTIEPFMKGTRFNHPIDLEFGPDGVLYVLEYGTNWFAKNKDAGLYRIEYLRGDKAADTVKFPKSDNAEPEIYLGVVNGNRSFYWSGEVINYSIDVRDREDGSLEEGKINADDVKASLSFTTLGTDLAMVVQAHENVTAPQPDLPLIANSDCKACHSTAQQSVGPSYLAIAERYRKDSATITKLASKIIEGGAGNWGKEHAMSAHPQLSMKDAREMVEYILSLNNPATETKRIGVKGKIVPDRKKSTKGDYIITVTYKDKEQPGSGSNVARETFYIRYPSLRAVAAEGDNGVERAGTEAVLFKQQDSWILFRQLDLTGIGSVTLHYTGADKAGTVTLKTGSLEGEEIGSITIAQAPGKSGTVRIPLAKMQGLHDLYIVYKSKEGVPEGKHVFSLTSIDFNKR
jgi:glucose/arabinose dehydrogenase/cytochrome c551/c552